MCVYQGLGRLGRVGLADQERLPYFYEFHDKLPCDSESARVR